MQRLSWIDGKGQKCPGIYNTQETTKEVKCCQPVMTNEGPALDSRALAQDLTKVRLSLP